MEVEVRLFAVFRDGRFKKRVMDLPDGSRLRDVLQRLDIAADDVSIALVNGQHSELDRQLASDDVFAVFPALGGG